MNPEDSAPEENRGPCAQDIKVYCYGVEPGDGRIMQCLAANHAGLSVNCREVQGVREALAAQMQIQEPEQTPEPIQEPSFFSWDTPARITPDPTPTLEASANNDCLGWGWYKPDCKK